MPSFLEPYNSVYSLILPKTHGVPQVHRVELPAVRRVDGLRIWRVALVDLSVGEALVKFMGKLSPSQNIVVQLSH